MPEAAAPAPQPALPEHLPQSAFPEPSPGRRRLAGGDPCPFADLRSVRWRINLGILPYSLSSVDDLRRVSADSRRKYANLRRRLLVDPHILKDEKTSQNVLMDNPLSQNPDSIWGRFFQNAELEKMVDQDLARLYPEHGSYFQTSGCQGILRRILLLWCLRHPEFGYKQGMHEILAPLLYVLQVDVEHLSQVRKLYEDHFTDKFDELSSYENDLYHFDVRRSTDGNATDDGSQGSAMKMMSLDEVDPDIKRIILLADAYGAEGELGIVLSEKFMEHDAYSMFDALMRGGNGSVAIADFFSHAPLDGSCNGLPPVIEASEALYNLLSIVDSSLLSHLVELGVEPQYFALRWLRILFGREFSLADLLVIWDKIFMFENNRLEKRDEDNEMSTLGLLGSPRGAFIAGLAVSMILYLRSSLLATEHATSCLQKLLNFPENVNLNKLIEKAKSLQGLALDPSILSALPQIGSHDRRKSVAVRACTLSSDSVSPSSLTTVPDSYWEERWRVMHKSQELERGSAVKEAATKKKGWSHRLRLSFSRTESYPPLAKAEKEINTSVQRNLLDDLSVAQKCNEVIEETNCQRTSVEKGHGQNFAEVEIEKENSRKDLISTPQVGFLGRQSEGSSPVFSRSSSPISLVADLENDSNRSSVASNRSADEQYHLQPAGETMSPLINGDAPEKPYHAYGSTEKISVPHVGNVDAPAKCDSDSTEKADEPHTYNSDPINDSAEKADVPLTYNGDAPSKCDPTSDSTDKTVTGLKERKLLSGKFQWFRRFGRSPPTEATSDKGGNTSGASKSSEVVSKKDNSTGSSLGNNSASHSVTSKGDGCNNLNIVGTLNYLGQSMLEHVQVIEAVLQQGQIQSGSPESFSASILVDEGQVTAMGALKELRRISDLLSEM
ncbi:hypothetical protein SAY86_026891 [Trapa natans]|uniref:Rab-GAP TBC domain-containing protein n=1 Tax=Trapa natans TaxID=22666 RepID=A0AAN7KSH7_TRANT|nr:hypothetical protein SAY86_026891 [Trapa natans]